MSAYNIITKNALGQEEVFLIVQAESIEDAERKAECNKALMLMTDSIFVRVEARDGV